MVAEPTPFDLIGPVLTDIVKQANVAVSPKPSRVIHIQPGAEVAWDESCGGGQLWGRVVTIAPATGTQPRSAAPCGVLYWNVVLAVGIVRCVAGLKNDGSPPSPRELSADGVQMTRDLQAIQQVILCHEKVSAIQNWLPSGPQGVYAGGEWIFTVRIGTCACGPQVEPH
jgi:hypothetical protein